jgi:hypothetical protein
MMKTMQKTMLASTSLPVLAESVDVRVIGNITPTACTPTLTGGGTNDYGVIPPASLSNTAFTVLPEKQIDISITCDAPAKVSIKTINGRPNTVAGSTEGAGGTAKNPDGVTLLGSTNIAVAGLGPDSTDKIGGHAMRIAQGTAVADGSGVDVLTSDDMNATWAKSTTGSIFNQSRTRHVSWGATGTTIPVAFETFNAKLGAQAYINKASELDLSKPVALDGLTTIELVYL